MRTGHPAHALIPAPILILALAAAFALPAPGGAEPRTSGPLRMQAATCAVPQGLLDLKAALPRTARLLAHGAPLRVVALGSSSSAGTGASSPEHSYPSEFAAALGRRYPKSPITVYNAGRGGELVADMLKRLKRDVLDRAPDLVIWQVGTNAVLRGTSPAKIDRGIHTGLIDLKAAGIDVVVMDPQYAPKVLAKADHDEIVAEVGREARANDDGLFQRYRIMRYWLDSGRFDVSRMLSPDQLHMNDASYRCVGILLARAIAATIDRIPAGPGAIRASRP